jgi:radical SAM-linked protein
MTDPVAPRVRTRLRFSKLGKVRFTSHRDTARIWERALRKAELPVAYTEGFSPRPRLSFGLALPTGHESLAEYLDVDLLAGGDVPDLDATVIPTRLDSALPAGFAVQGSAVVEPGTPSLQEAVTSCSWRIELLGTDSGEVGAAVEHLLDDDHLVVTRERKGRLVEENLRAALIELTPSGSELVAELATQPQAMRPAEVVAALAIHLPGAALGRVCRTHQWIRADGSRREPLPSPPGLEEWTFAAAAGPAPHAQRRAS